MNGIGCKRNIQKAARGLWRFLAACLALLIVAQLAPTTTLAATTEAVTASVHRHTESCYATEPESGRRLLVCALEERTAPEGEEWLADELAAALEQFSGGGDGVQTISGSQIAEDGTYSATVTATKNKDGKTYTGTVYVYVTDGKISGLSIYAAKKSDRFQDALYEIMYDLIGKAASPNSVDAVTSASLSGGSSSGKYSMDLLPAIKRALEGADPASGGSGAAVTPVADGVYRGTYAMDNGHYITLDVTVKDGVISTLTIVEADGSWVSLLSSESGNYVGQTAAIETVDAVTSATGLGYREAIKNAILDALGGAPQQDPGGSGESDDTKKYVFDSAYDAAYDKDENTEYATGGTVSGKTFDGPVYVMDETQVTFLSCTFQAGIYCESDGALAFIGDGTAANACTFLDEASGYGLTLAGNVFSTVYTNTELTAANTTAAVYFPGATASQKYESDSATLTNSSLTAKPAWATGTYDSVSYDGSSYYGYTFTGTTPATPGYQLFSVSLTYTGGYGTLDTVVPMLLNVVEGTAPGGDEEDPIDPGPGGSETEVGGGISLTKGVNVTNVVETTEVALDLEAFATADEVVSTTDGKGANIVMVIDTSGSIVGKEEALNSAIQGLVKDLPDGSQLGVVTFNETASSGTIYTRETISGLSFSGQENMGTLMAGGISSAWALLNRSGWENPDNNKVLVLISDFDVGDYCDAINEAKTVKAGGGTVYSVRIDKSDVDQTTTLTELSTDSRAASVVAFTAYVSSNYPTASAVNNSMFGMFNMATVTPGEAVRGYCFGAAGGDWSRIFATIQQEVITYATVTLDADSIFRDQVNTDVFDVSGATATVTVYDYENGSWTQLAGSAVAACGGEGALSAWPGKVTADGTIAVQFSADGTVDITGFSYKDHYLPESGAEAPGVNAQKLHLTISGLKLKDGVRTATTQSDVPTNVEALSGVYADGSEDEPTKRFPLPTVNIPGKGGSASTAEDVSCVTVTKQWAEGSTVADTVYVGLYADGQLEQTIQLTADENWTATVDVEADKTYTVGEEQILLNGEDVTDRYTNKITVETQTQTGDPVERWLPADSLQSGHVYVFLTEHNGAQASLVTAYSGSTLTISLEDAEFDADGDLTNVQIYSKWLVETYTGTNNGGYSPTWTLFNQDDQQYLYASGTSYLFTENPSDAGSVRFSDGAGGNLIVVNTAGNNVNLPNYSFTAYELTEVTTTTNTATYTITNTEKQPETVTVKLLKTDEQGKPLPGAVFGLDGASYTSGADGCTEAMTLACGQSYTLTETDAPDGYEKLTRPIVIKAAADGSVTAVAYGTAQNYAVTREADGSYVITVPNTLSQIVDTGLSLDERPYVLCAAVAGLGLFLMLYRRRRGAHA